MLIKEMIIIVLLILVAAMNCINYKHNGNGKVLENAIVIISLILVAISIILYFV